MIWNKEFDKVAGYTKEINTSSRLVRLVEDSEIKKNIQFDELSTLNLSSSPDPDGGEQQIQTAGYEYPMIRINDFVFSKFHIMHMNIDCSKFVPTISLTLAMSNTFFVDKNMPKDGDIVSTFIRTNTEALSYLRNDFIITSCYTNLDSNDGENIVNIEGKLFIPKLDSTNNTLGLIGTSKSALKEVAKYLSIGFSYNDFDDTDDLQTWLCCNDTVENYVYDIVYHSWKDELSFYSAWIDLYYDLCFVNINKFLLSDENTEDEIDVTFRTHTLSISSMYAQPQDEENTLATMKIFSNRSDYKGSPFFIREWSPINNSTRVSMSNGYQVDSYTFLHNQHLYTKDSSICFETLSNIPAYDKNKLDSYILLRGRAKYEKGKNPEDEQERVNYDFVNTYIRKDWSGVEYVKADDEKDTESNNTWSGNVHKNYNRAAYHNDINLAELNKLYITITCDGLCLQVMRGERIPVYLVYNTQMDEAVNNSLEQSTEASGVNKFYSGYYIVDSLSYSYEENGTPFNNFSTTMVLKRREWPTPEKISKS